MGFGLSALIKEVSPLPSSVALWSIIVSVVVGAGVGTGLPIITIVVQNAAPFAQLGAATGALTFFRQVGGTVGLAIAGTLFGSALATEIPVQMTKAGVPQQLVKQFGLGGGRKGRRGRPSMAGLGRLFG